MDWIFETAISDPLDLKGMQTGGPGVIVEVDEIKLGNRKYHRGIALQVYG